MRGAFDNTYEGQTVLITGHTGFKGSWLSIWLRELGARVIGYSLEPPTQPSNYALSRLAERVVDVRGDVRDLSHLRETIDRYRPQVVFHLAAQPLVLPSYHDPKTTLDTNVGGTVNLLEAVRAGDGVRAVVCVTTDKVYRNREWLWGYRENDELGGHDPYSTSKAMAELAVASYRQSFFPPARYAEHGVALASARAANVIGGGDWGSYRLIPDCMRALLGGQPIHLRNPAHVRPWQIVFESLSGYLVLGARLLGEHAPQYAEAWNLGPVERRGITTEQLVQRLIALWGGGSYTTGSEQTEVETAMLRINSDKATIRLDWVPVYDWEEALAETVRWYRHYARLRARAEVDMYEHCVDQIARYAARAQEAGLSWAGGTS